MTSAMTMNTMAKVEDAWFLLSEASGLIRLLRRQRHHRFGLLPWDCADWKGTTGSDQSSENLRITFQATFDRSCDSALHLNHWTYPYILLTSARVPFLFNWLKQKIHSRCFENHQAFENEMKKIVIGRYRSRKPVRHWRNSSIDERRVVRPWILCKKSSNFSLPRD